MPKGRQAKIAAEVARKEAAGVCLSCERRKPVSRGCCKQCNDERGIRVGVGQVTEEQLIDAGLLLPGKAPGRPKSPPSGIAAFAAKQ